MTIRRRIIELHRLFLAHDLTLSAAESCTGGWIAKLLTDLPGSSRTFKGGVVAYSNEVKMKLLGVKKETLERCGAVSEETCREMCLGVQALTGSDLSVSVTGIAGPGGGSPEKPAGTVFAGFFIAEEVIIKRFSFKGGRDSVRRQACLKVLETLIALLKEQPFNGEKRI